MKIQKYAFYCGVSQIYINQAKKTTRTNIKMTFCDAPIGYLYHNHVETTIQVENHVENATLIIPRGNNVDSTLFYQRGFNGYFPHGMYVVIKWIHVYIST